MAKEKMKKRLILLILIGILIIGCKQKEQITNFEYDGIKLKITYSEWAPFSQGGMEQEICYKLGDCESCYHIYKDLLPYEERCCGESGCGTPCGPFPDLEKNNAEADIILCLCNKTNNDTQIIKELIKEINKTDMTKFYDNNLCEPIKIYAI